MMYLDRIGAESRPERHTWEPEECALYAVENPRLESGAPLEGTWAGLSKREW